MRQREKICLVHLLPSQLSLPFSSGIVMLMPGRKRRDGTNNFPPGYWEPTGGCVWTGWFKVWPPLFNIKVPVINNSNEAAHRLSAKTCDDTERLKFTACADVRWFVDVFSWTATQKSYEGTKLEEGKWWNKSVHVEQEHMSLYHKDAISLQVTY